MKVSSPETELAEKQKSLVKTGKLPYTSLGEVAIWTGDGMVIFI